MALAIAAILDQECVSAARDGWFRDRVVPHRSDRRAAAAFASGL